MGKLFKTGLEKRCAGVEMRFYLSNSEFLKSDWEGCGKIVDKEGIPQISSTLLYKSTPVLFKKSGKGTLTGTFTIGSRAKSPLPQFNLGLFGSYTYAKSPLIKFTKKFY